MTGTDVGIYDEDFEDEAPDPVWKDDCGVTWQRPFRGMDKAAIANCIDQLSRCDPVDEIADDLRFLADEVRNL